MRMVFCHAETGKANMASFCLLISIVLLQSWYHISSCSVPLHFPVINYLLNGQHNNCQRQKCPVESMFLTTQLPLMCQNCIPLPIFPPGGPMPDSTSLPEDPTCIYARSLNALHTKDPRPDPYL